MLQITADPMAGVNLRSVVEQRSGAGEVRTPPLRIVGQVMDIAVGTVADLTAVAGLFFRYLTINLCKTRDRKLLLVRTDIENPISASIPVTVSEA